jgi:hypothetical protein
MPVRLAESTYDVCACAEALWVISSNDASVVDPILAATRHRSWLDAREDSERCYCLAPTLAAASATASPAVTGRPVTVAVAEDGNSTASLFLKAYPIDAHQNIVFSIVLRDLSRCQVHPVKLLGYSTTPMTECRSAPAVNGTSKSTKQSEKVEQSGDAAKLANDDRSTIRVELHTPQQRLQLHLHFRAKTARLRTRIAPPGIDRSQGGQFVMGLAEPLTLRTRSGFNEPLRDLKLSVAPAGLYRLEYDHGVVSSPATKSWYTGVHVTSACSERGVGAWQDGGNKAASDEAPRIAQTLWKCAHNLLTGLNFTDPYKTGLMSALRKQDSYMSRATPSATSPASPHAAFTAAQVLKDTWMHSFPRGLPLPVGVVYMDAAQTTHAYRIDNATLQSPQMFTPHSYVLQMPTARVGQVHWFYLQVYNPFESHVAFSLIDEANSEASKRMRALGGLYFQPTGLETVPARFVPAASRYHCTGVTLNSNVRFSRMPIPCECRNVDIRRLNETYCEADLNGPVELTGSIDEATVWRSRSLSIVQSAAAYSSSSNVLADLNKLFAPDVDVGTVEGAISGAGATGGVGKIAAGASSAYSRPFLPQSSVASVWSIPARGTARIGPFLYAPRAATSAPEKSTFYLFNNFTGFERVDIFTSSGAAALALGSVAACLSKTGAPLTAEGVQGAREAARLITCSDGRWLPFAVSEPAAGQRSAAEVLVSALGQAYRIHVKNIGAVSATVHSITLDGVSCKAAQQAAPVPTNWFDALKTALFPSVPLSAADAADLNGWCRILPVELPPDTVLELWVTAPTSCDYAKVSRQLTFHLDDTVLGGGETSVGKGRTAEAESGKLVVDLRYQLADALTRQCLHQHGAGWNNTLLWGLALSVLTVALWQMLSLYWLTRQQHQKYASARQVKAKRPRGIQRRSGSNLGGSGSPGGSANAQGNGAGLVVSPSGTRLFTPRDEDVAARMGYAPANGPSTHHRQVDEVDLSDVVVANHHQSNGDTSPAVHDMRPKMRAVEALLAERHVTALPLPSPPRSPTKLSVNTAFTVTDATTVAAAAVAEPKLVFAEVVPEVSVPVRAVPVEVPELNKRSPHTAPPPGFGFSSGQTSAETQIGSLTLASALRATPDELGASGEHSELSVVEGVTPPLSNASSQVFDAPVLPTGSSQESFAAESAPVVAQAPGSNNEVLSVAAAPAETRSNIGKPVKATKGKKESVSVEGGAGSAPQPAQTTKKQRESKPAKKSVTAPSQDTPIAEAAKLDAESKEPLQPHAQTKAQGKQKAASGAGKSKQSSGPAPVVAPPAAEAVTHRRPLQGGNAVDSADLASAALSPLRLQSPAQGPSHQSSEDSPLFRYNGQLLDPMRDSNAALDSLIAGNTPVSSLPKEFVPHFPAGVTGATCVVPGGTFGSAQGSRDNSGKEDSLLLPDSLDDNFDEVLRAMKSSDALSLDIGMDLTLLPGPDLHSPQDILAAAAGGTSELRVTADPFFSSLHYDSVGSCSRLRSDSSTLSGQRPRGDSTTGSSYLNDLLATAQAAAHTALDTSDHGPGLGFGDASAPEWFPSAGRAQHSAVPAQYGSRDAQDSYFVDLGSTNDYGGLRYSGDLYGDPSMETYGTAYQNDYGEYGGVYGGADYAAQHGYNYGDRYTSQGRQHPTGRNKRRGSRGSYENRVAAGGGYFEDPRGSAGAGFDGYGGGGPYRDYQRNGGPYFDRVDRNSRTDRHDPRDRHQRNPAHPPQQHQAGRGGMGAGVRQNSAPLPHQRSQHGDTRTAPLAGHSFDFLDDPILDVDAGSWVQSLTQQADTEHSFPHRGGGRSGAGGRQAIHQGAPGLAQRSADRAFEHRYQQDLRGPSPAGYEQRQQPLYRDDQTSRHQRLLPPQGPSLPGAPGLSLPSQSSLSVDYPADTGLDFNPFARPEQSTQWNPRPGAFGASPGRTGATAGNTADSTGVTEHDGWLTLNTPGGTLTGLRGGPGANGGPSPQSRPTSLGAPRYAAEFQAAPEADAMAAELRFFHPTSFFGDAGLGVALEPLEGLLRDDDDGNERDDTR